MHGQAYLTSAEHAGQLGPFEGFALNREPMLRVMEMHRDAVEAIDPSAPPDLVEPRPAQVWDACLEARPEARLPQQPGDGPGADRHDRLHDGLRHDGGRARHRPGEVQAACRRRDAQDRQPDRADGPAEARLRRAGDPGRSSTTSTPTTRSRGRPGLHDEHLPVFDCAFAPPQGGRSIHFRGHLRMMAAVQPFLSGAISKTCNVPSDATVDDIREAYLEGWKLGLKALAIYRDGSKGSQPVSTKSETDTKADADAAAARRRRRAGPGPRPARRSRSIAGPDARVQPRRERLPHTRRSLTHKFDIQGHEGYVTVGFYPDGRPGELFITMAKEGSTIGGLMDVLGTSISIGLQYGVPLEVFVNKFAHSRFEPAGFTKNPDIPIAKSIDRLHLPLARHGVHPRLPRGQRPPAPGRRASRRARSADRQGQRPPDRHDRRPRARRGRPRPGRRRPAPAPGRRSRPSTAWRSATSSSPTSRATPPPATTAAP